MGFDINGVRLLINSKKEGVNFNKVVMIGRQGLHLPYSELKKLLSDLSINNEIDYNAENEKYAESFLKSLGAFLVDSIDASDYENATIIHDMNNNIPENLKFKYTTVIDGGSLEHIFNFPVAIKSCMELIEKGGYYIGITPTNNFLGHGFYQFSPELYYRVFSENNGFKIIKMLFYTESNNLSQLYSVKDPNDVKHRVTLVNSFPSYLFVIAQKTEVKNIFSLYPQQSDYQHLVWENKKEQPIEKGNKHGGISFLKKFVPLSIKLKIIKLIKRYHYKKTILEDPIGIGQANYFEKVEK